MRPNANVGAALDSFTHWELAFPRLFTARKQAMPVPVSDNGCSVDCEYSDLSGGESVGVRAAIRGGSASRSFRVGSSVNCPTRAFRISDLPLDTWLTASSPNSQLVRDGVMRVNNDAVTQNEHLRNCGIV